MALMFSSPVGDHDLRGDRERPRTSIFSAAGPLVVVRGVLLRMTMLHGVGLHGRASIGHMIESSTRFTSAGVLGEMFPVATPGLWLLAAVACYVLLPGAQGRAGRTGAL